MRHYVSFGLNICFYLHDCVRPAGNRNNVWQMMLEHVRANIDIECCGGTRNAEGTLWSPNIENFIMKSQMICSLGQLIHSCFLQVRYTLGPFKLHEVSLKVHDESVLLRCQMTLSIISFLFCFVNLGFDKSNVIILGLYQYFRTFWIWFLFLPPNVHIGYVHFIYPD
jgi:hypothetical protein